MKIILIFLANLFLVSTLCQSKTELVKKLIQEKKFDEAINILSPINTKDRDYAEAQYYLGIIAYKQKMYDAAADYFEEAVKYNNHVSAYYSRLGNTYGTIAQNANIFMQGYLAPKMKAAWEKASDLDPKNTEARWALVQYYTQAPSFMGGSFEKAGQMAAEIGKINKADGHRAMGTVYHWEKKTAEAEKEFIEMAKLNPAFGYVLGDFYALQKLYEKAFNLLEDLVKKNPTDYVSLYHIGKTSVLAGQRSDRGEECLKKYLSYLPQEHEPTLASANMLLGKIYEKKGNKTGARMYYTAAIKEDANNKEAREGLERVSE